MNKFRIVDTSFRILKGGKIGLAASIALIGGMLTLGSTSANAVNYDVGNGWLSGNSITQSDLIPVVSSQNSVEVSSNDTFHFYDWLWGDWYSQNGTTSYNGTISVAAGQNLTGENINGTVYGVYSKDTTPNGYTTEVNLAGATLNLAGNNTISGLVGVNVNTNNTNGGVDALSTINIATGTVTFNNNVYANNIEINSGANVNFYGNIDGQSSSVIDYNGHNATVTLNDGSNLDGSIVKSSGSTNGTLIFEGDSHISGSVADSSSTIGLVTVRGEGKEVTIVGNLSTDHLDYQAASTVTVNGDLILDVKTASNAVNQVTFDSHEGVLNVGGDIIGVEGKDTITTTGHGVGTVTMLGGNGNQEITGNIGTSANKIGTLNIGNTNGEDASNTTVNGDIFATTIKLNNYNYDTPYANSTLTMASDYNITSDIETNQNGYGILNLAGGTQTVDGQVGTDTIRLAKVNSGEDGATSTFKDSVYATTVQNLGTGSSIFESAVHATNVNVDNSYEDSDTGSVVTFKDTVDSSFINITGNGEDSVPSVSFEKLVTVSDDVVITDAEVTVGKAAVGEVPAVPANMTVGNDVTIGGSIVDVTGNLTLTGGASTLTIQDSSEFNITGNVALDDDSDNTRSIEIKDSKATFNGTVIVADNNGNLNITDTTVASNVKFNGIVDIGNNISIDNNIAGEDAYTLVPENIVIGEGEEVKLNYVPNTLATKVEFNANVTGNNLSVDNSVVSFGNLASGTGENAIAENAVVANIENNLNLTNSYVTLNGDLNVTNDMTVGNSYGKFTASGVNASVTVENTLTIDDATNSLDNVSFITVDSKLNVGEDFVVSGNDNNNNNNNSFLKIGEETAIVLNDNVTVGNDLSISSAFVSLLGSGNGEDALNVSNNVDVNNSLLAMKGGDITVGLDMAVNSSSHLIVGVVDYTYMTDYISNGGTPIGDYSANSSTNMDIGRNLTINNSTAMLGNEAGLNNGTFGKNTVNVTVAGNATIENGSDVQMVGDLTLTGATSILTISGSSENKSFDIVGDTLLSGNGATSIVIDDSNATFDGTVTVASANGDLNISNGSDATFNDIVTIGDDVNITGTARNTEVTFNGQQGENPAVFVGGDMNIANSTVTFGTVNGEDNTISALTNVEVGNDLSIYGSEVTFNDTVAVGHNLNIADSAVTFNKAVNIENESYIYSYSGSTVDFKDTVVANSDIFVGSDYYGYVYNGNTTVTFDKNLTITTGEDSFGTLHLDSDYVTVNANGHIYANVQFGEDAELNVADTKNIYGTVRTTADEWGILNFLGTTTLQGDIGEDSMKLYEVSFAATGEDTGSFTQDIGYNVYSYNTYIGNGYNQVKANVTNDITFGGDVEVRNGSTLNVSNKDVNVGALILDSGSTTSFKVSTTDISASQAVENVNSSGSITADYRLSISSDAKINITYEGSLYGAGKYNLISAGSYGFSQGEDYIGTEANGLVTDNSIIDSVVKRYVDTDGKEYLTLYADRTGNGSYDAEKFYIEKSGIGNNYSNAASTELMNLVLTENENLLPNTALYDINKKMTEGDLTDEKKQELVKAQKLLAPVANNSGLQSSLNASNLALGTIGGRISDVRGAGGSILALNDNSSNATGLSAGESTLDTALWIKAVGSTATQDKVGQYDGYDANTYGIVTGFDKTLKDGTILGFALAYSDTNTDQSDFRSGDSSDTNSIQVTAYASKEFGNLYVDGMLSYAKHSTDATRTANSGKLTADIDANQYSAKIESGYRFVLEGDTTLTPFASIEYGTLDQKSYTEKGTTYQNDALKVDDVSINRGTAGLGAKLTTNVKVGNTKLVPEFKLAAYNSFGDDSADIKAQYVGGGNKFITPGQELNQTIYNIGAGVKTAISESSTLILNVDHDRSGDGDFTGYSGSVSYRYSF